MRANHGLGARAFVLLLSVACGAAFAVGACGNDMLPSDTTTTGTSGGGSMTTSTTTTTTTATTTTASSGGTGGTGGKASGTGGAGTGGTADCYTNPMTHLEIINACTSAQEVDLNPVLPLLEADGGLPPLP